MECSRGSSRGEVIAVPLLGEEEQGEQHLVWFKKSECESEFKLHHTPWDSREPIKQKSPIKARINRSSSQMLTDYRSREQHI